MKKIICSLLILVSAFMFVACGNGKCCEAIELMGAGDRIHDTYTFANTGVSIQKESDNTYVISGNVQALESKEVKEEFKIAEDVSHVVAIKLTAIDTDVKKDEVNISCDGIRAYDAEHLNGSDYTFIILEAVPDSSVAISVKWNKNAEEKNYVVKFSKDLVCQ